MRRIKKTFNYSNVKVVDTKTKEVLLEDKREGKQDEAKVAIDFIKSNGYNPNLEITVKEEEVVYTMSAEDFMKYGELVVEEKTIETPVEA